MVMQSEILNTDWSEYDERKVKVTKSLKDFNPHSGWEVNFLVNKIVGAHPEVDPMTVKIAIYTYSQSMKPPYWREQIVEWIEKRVGI